jgi:hypothetical protein
MDANSVRNMQSVIAVTNKHTANLHHVGSLYILTYDARKIKHKISSLTFHCSTQSDEYVDEQYCAFPTYKTEHKSPYY